MMDFFPLFRNTLNGSITVQTQTNYNISLSGSITASGGSVYVLAGGRTSADAILGTGELGVEIPVPAGIRLIVPPNVASNVFLAVPQLKPPVPTVIIQGNNSITNDGAATISINTIIGQGTITLNNASISATAQAATPLEPISFREGQLTLFTELTDQSSPLCTITTKGWFQGAMTTDGVQISSGDCLVHAAKSCKVHLPGVELEVPPKSVLLIEKSSVLRIKNISAKSVNVRITNQRSSLLEPAHEIVFVSDKPNLAAADLNDGIARRRQGVSVSQDSLIMTSEFSMSSALTNIELFRALRQSTLAQYRKLTDSIFKTTAALSMITANHGLFSTRYGTESSGISGKQVLK